MIREIHIENFKSVQDLQMQLGRINVFIGENGSGKSNILEAIVMASAAADDKLDNEFLSSRGIRMTRPQFMRSAFGPTPEGSIKMTLTCEVDVDGNKVIEFVVELQSDENSTIAQWENIEPSPQSMLVKIALAELDEENPPDYSARANAIFRSLKNPLVPAFLIYSPENSALRVFETEGQILPLGIKGEGILAHLKALGSEKYKHLLEKISTKLALLDWFESFEAPRTLEPIVLIRDRYLAEGSLFDQRSANEGFLFLLFYFTLFISPDTPKFFAIDNIDASLNPKMCARLTKELIQLAKEHDKQAIFTTHNPAVLDGLDLTDDEQRLFVIKRNLEGHTKIKRVLPPKEINGTKPVTLSEAFLRGYLGGLPENF